MRDAGDVEDRIVLFHGVEAGVVAEWAFASQLVELYVAFENDLRMRRDFEIDRLAFHQLDRLLPQKSGNQILFHIGWRRHNCSKGCRRISSDGYRDFEAIIFQVAERDSCGPSGGFGHCVNVLSGCRP